MLRLEHGLPKERAMLPNRNVISLCALSLCALTMPSPGDAALVTHFNFNDYDGDSTAINADSGSYAAGGSGVPTATLAGWSASQLNVDSDGTDMNAVESVPADDNNAIRLQSISGASPSITVDLDTLGYSGLQLSFAGKGPNGTYQVAEIAYLEYSVNGNTYVAVPPTYDPSDPYTYQIVSFDLSGISAINNASNVSLRLTLSDASGSGTGLLIDNLRIDALATVPEPHSVAMALMALLFAGFYWWKSQYTTFEHLS